MMLATTKLQRLRKIAQRSLEKAEDWCAFREAFFPHRIIFTGEERDFGPGGVTRAEADRRARRWFELHTRAERRIHRFVPPPVMGARR
jgi:hypothetical protein